MIDKQELKERQESYDLLRLNPSPEVIKLREDWKTFLNLFSEKAIKEMTKENYVLGLENYKDSFCYWIETKLNKLGNMHGATSFKFGLYYGKTDSDPNTKYRWTKKFGNSTDTPDIVFSNVKESLINLLITGREFNLDKIKDNLLSPMFKGKILFLYYPEKFICILSNDHLNYFLNELDIPYSEELTEIEKRDLLIKFKNSDPIMRSWRNYEFSDFLYKFYRPPKKSFDTNHDEAEQNEIINKATNMTEEEIINELREAIPITEETVEFRGKTYKRDNKTVALLKKLRNFKCQICSTSILKKNGEFYIEASHITAKHKKGSELPENILILCPNHHKEFDFGDRKIVKRSSEELFFQLNNKEYKISLKLG